MGATSLIPTFKPGQRVMLDYRPYEMCCPKCGRVLAHRPTFRREVTVLGESNMGLCDCGAKIWLGPGWYQVDVKSVIEYYPYLVVPYTLLTPLEEGDTW